MKRIKLTQGQFALVDDADFDWLSRWHWTYDNGYAHRMDGNKKVYMHRLIMGEPNNKQIDHKNEDGETDGLNNQRYNLRIASHSQNCFNRGLQKNNTSGFKGLYWNQRERRWIARIKYCQRYHYLGRFVDKVLAAKAYDDAAIKYFGEFAKLNLRENV